LKGNLFITLILATLVWQSNAQSVDSLRQRADSLLNRHTSHQDSTILNVNNKIDSTQLKINTILNPDINKLSSRLKKTGSGKQDTLNVVHGLDSAKQRIGYQIDSLKRLNLPTDKLTKKIDSLNQLDPSQYLSKPQGKINELEDKLNKPVSKVEAGLNEKLTLMNKEGGAGANLPGNSNLPNAELSTNLKSSIELPAHDLKVDNPLNSVENPLQNQLDEVDAAKGKVNEVKNLPNEQFDKVKSIEEIQGAQGKIGQANELTDKGQAYSKDVKNISQGNMEGVKELPKSIEDKAKNLVEIKELQGQTGELGKYQEMATKGNDPEAMKALAKEQTITYAKDHFAGKQEVLQASMNKLAKLQAKYTSLDSISNLPRFKPNQMKGKPFIERIVPGLTFQIQKSLNVLIDYSAVVGYRINGRVTIGAGWNERIGVGKKLSFTTSDRIYGPRTFLDCMIFKGFSARVDIEKMHTDAPPGSIYTADGSAWVWSAFAGVKKQYNFTRHVKGNFQFLYNFYDDHDKSPYTERFNVRFGFDFPMKKKAKAYGPTKG